MKQIPLRIWLVALLLLPAGGQSAVAATILGTPESYLGLVAALKPGDTLRLATGVYRHGLPLHELRGEIDRPIVIEGDTSGVGTAFLGRTGANTVSIRNASHLVVRSLLLDGNNLPVDAVKAEGTSRFADHITLERLTIISHGADQQVVGISTKCPAWGWVIRGNTIRGAGTGIYLGNSDGEAPFVAGLIEHNLIVDSIGYNLQIKHQLSRPSSMPVERTQTVIRHNVFSKASGGSSGSMARPNVLLGSVPLRGVGTEDGYSVYGNFFHENPAEALFQAEGNVEVFDNIFFNSLGDALHIAPHNRLPRRIEVRHNTIVAKGAGIVVTGGDSRFVQWITANAVYAGSPIVGGAQRDNLTGEFALAAHYLQAPFAPLGQMDFSPRANRLDLSPEASSLFLSMTPIDFFGRAFRKPVAGAVAATLDAPWGIGLTVQPSKP